MSNLPRRIVGALGIGIGGDGMEENVDIILDDSEMDMRLDMDMD